MFKQIIHIVAASFIILIGCCACATRTTIIKPEGEDISRTVSIGNFNAIHAGNVIALRHGRHYRE